MSAKKIVITALAVIGFIALTFVITFWSHFTSFYKDCMKIHEGMSAAEAEEILRPYIESDRFGFGREGALNGEGLYVDSNFSGDQCYMEIRDGVVTKFLPRFEP